MKKLVLIAITSWFYLFSQAQTSRLSDTTIRLTFSNPVDIAYRFDIHSLHVNTSYYFAIDAVNDTGITKGKTILKQDSSY